jgi:hypothetical protein
MKNFIVILREPDGRTEQHAESEIREHRQHIGEWFQKYKQSGNVLGGSALALEGKQVKGTNGDITNDIHKVGTEIVGGFILLNAKDLDEAVFIMQTCPIYEFGGYAEIREFLTT